MSAEARAPLPLAPNPPYEPIPAEALDQSLAARFADVVRRHGDASDLREFLRRRLPAQMVPAAFVALDELPVTGAGKIDRRALPAPGARASRVAPVAPRTPLEERLAVIWAAVLGLDSVGVEDSFLDLGGNSLLATMVVNRVLEDVRTDVSVAALLAAPTVAGMAVVVAAHLAQRLPTGLLSELVDGDPPGRPDALR